MTSQVRLAVWGLGRHAIHRLLPAVSASPGLTLRGVCSRNPESVRQCADRWSCLGWTDPSAMLSDGSVDVVYVATPIGVHAEHGEQVLEAGKHLWCEKPLTSRLHSTLELVALSRARGLSICEGHMFLYHPQFQYLRRVVSSGRLGRIVSVGCRFGIPVLEHPGFRNDPALDGGGLFDVGCYPISALQALFPQDSHQLAYSTMSFRDGSRIDTDGQAVIDLSNGAVAHLEWRRNTAYRNEIDVWGDKGSLFTDKIFSKPADYHPVFRTRDLHGEETIEQVEAANHFVCMFQAFLEMIYHGEAIESERRRILRSAETMDQIWSASNGKKRHCGGATANCGPRVLGG